MRRISFAVVVAMALSGVFGSAMAEDVVPGLQKEVTLPDGCVTQEGAEFKDGKWVLPDGTPTFRVCKKDNTLVVDWATYNGYRRYHGECHVCHGPNGLGSTYAPALAESLKTCRSATSSASWPRAACATKPAPSSSCLRSATTRT